MAGAVSHVVEVVLQVKVEKQDELLVQQKDQHYSAVAALRKDNDTPSLKVSEQATSAGLESEVQDLLQCTVAALSRRGREEELLQEMDKYRLEILGRHPSRITSQ